MLNRLYTLPPERFIAARDEAVAAARRAGLAEQDAARVLAELTAQLDELRDRQAQAQLGLRQARLRLKAAQRAAARTGA